MPIPSYHVAAEALFFDPSYYEGLQEHYLEARDFMYEALTKAGFELSLPRGAYYLFTKYGKLAEKLNAKDDVDFSIKLIARCKVATVPGSSFFSNRKSGKNFVRFCICKKWETIKIVKDLLATF